MFENPSHYIKSIVRFMFKTCLILSILLFAIGAFQLLSVVEFGGHPSFLDVISYTAEDYAYGIAHDYEWYIDGYLAKVQCKNAITIALASLSCLPLYAFACMVEDVQEIKNQLSNKKEQ